MVHSFQSFMILRLHSIVEKTYHIMHMGEVGDGDCHASVDHSMLKSTPSAHDHMGDLCVRVGQSSSSQVSPHSLADMILKEEFEKMEKMKSQSCDGGATCAEFPSDITESSDAYEVHQSSLDSSQSML